MILFSKHFLLCYHILEKRRAIQFNVKPRSFFEKRDIYFTHDGITKLASMNPTYRVRLYIWTYWRYPTNKKKASNCLGWREKTTFERYPVISHGCKMWKSNQHVDFPSGHPPEYYPRLSLVNFAERTGCSGLRLIWPITTDYFILRIYSNILIFII